MENYHFGLNGDFVLGYRLALPEMYSLGEGDYDTLNDVWTKALKDLPDNTIFLKQDIFNESKLDTSSYNDRNFIEESNKQYFNGREYLEHITNIFFIRPNRIVKEKSLKNPFRPPVKKDFVAFDENIEEFIESVEQTVRYLSNVFLTGKNKMSIDPLGRDYLNGYYDYYMSGLQDDYNAEIKKHKKWNYLQVGDQYVSILKFPKEDKFPESLKTSQTDGDFTTDKSVFFKNYGDNFAFKLKFKHIYNQVCVIDEKKKHIDTLVKNNRILHKTRRLDKSNEHYAKLTDEDLKVLVKKEETERIIRGHNNVIVYADSENELKSRIDKVVEQFKDLDIKPDRVFGDNLLAIFEYSYPLNASRFIENHFYVSSIQGFASFMVLKGKYNDDKTGIQFNSRIDNTPVIVDLWDDEKKLVNARNFFVISGTGGGKSFTCNHIISGNVANHTKVVIVDLGGSYRKLSSLFPNRTAYISYNDGESLGINAFDLKGNITPAKIEEVVEFIGVHYRTEREINPRERVSLKKIVELYYNNVPIGHSLPHFLQSFAQEKEEILEKLEIKKEYFDADEFLLLMSEYMDNGLYSFLYKDDGKQLGEDIFDKDIIVFELDKIRGNKLLLTVMLQLISNTINKVIWADKETKGLLLFDEVAEQLQWEGMLRRIQWFYQAIRKQNSAIGIVLQSISQLPQSELSNSIVENTQILYILGAKNFKPLQERFSMSEHAFYQMNSLKSDFTGEKKYSEIFLMRGDKHQVYRLEVSPEVFWAYQTDGAMNALLMRIYDEVGDMEQAIKIMIDNQKEIEQIAEETSISKEEKTEKIKSLINKNQSL